MKNIRVFGLGLALALGLGFSSTALAQTPTPTTQAGKTESCCAMDSCRKGESGAMKDHAKKEHTTSASAHKDGCCCCSGDSCDMKMQHSKETNHAAKEAGCCKGDSCSMSHEVKEHGKDQVKQEHTKMAGMHKEMHQGMTAATHGNKDACCCCSGDSCDMKMTHEPEKAKG